MFVIDRRHTSAEQAREAFMFAKVNGLTSVSTATEYFEGIVTDTTKLLEAGDEIRCLLMPEETNDNILRMRLNFRIEYAKVRLAALSN